jgi:hypothetical protein
VDYSGCRILRLIVSKMPYKCSAFGCKTGYKRKNDSDDTNESQDTKRSKPTLHAFPKDPDLLQQWIRANPRKDFIPTKNARLCSMHFQSSDFIEVSQDSNITRRKLQPDKPLALRYLKKDAVPSIFPNAPDHLSKSRKSPRKTKLTTASSRREEAVRNIELLSESFRVFDDITGLPLDDIETRLINETTRPSGFKTTVTDQGLLIYIITTNDTVPTISASVTVSSELSLTVCCNGSAIPESLYSDIVNDSLQTMSQLVNLIARVKVYAEESELTSLEFWLQVAVTSLQTAREKTDDEGISRKLSFALEQLELISCNKYGRHYSPDLSVFSYLIQATSAAAYATLQEQDVLCLPSVRTLKKISRRLNVNDGLDNSAYLRLRVSKLNELERAVILITDEIYVARRIEYSAGQVVGLTRDGTVASTLLCFAVKSLACKNMDLIAIYPMDKLTADKLNQCYLEVAKLLKSVSLHVVSLSVDNAATNRKFFTDCLCDGELKTQVIDKTTGQPLFLIIDPVHTLKNVYNNFQCRKTFHCPPLEDDLPNGCLADFRHIVELFNVEEAKPLKKAHQLRQAALQPKSIEKTSVKLAVSVFCESTRDALNFYAEHEGKSEWRGTADCVKLITKLWHVLNVKTCGKGSRKRDYTMDPVRTSWDWQLQFLKDFAQFVREWQFSLKPGLTRETFLALRHTCLAIAECAVYLLETKGFDVVLLGHLQSDPIESRFGWLRQMSGANYYISTKQVMDNDRKIRAVSLLKFSGISLTEIDAAIQSGNSSTTNGSADDDHTADDIAEQLTFEHIPETSDLNIIYYVAGYIARSVCRSTRCDNCREALCKEVEAELLECNEPLPYTVSTFFESVNRGGLKKPTDFTFQLTSHCWTVHEEIRCNEQLMGTFLSASCQRTLFCQIMDRATCHHSVVNWGLNNYYCTDGHDLTTFVVHIFFNCVAKNLVKSMTGHANLHSEHQKQQRKQNKLCSKLSDS